MTAEEQKTAILAHIEEHRRMMERGLGLTSEHRGEVE
jgi:hypothetical protein